MPRKTRRESTISLYDAARLFKGNDRARGRETNNAAAILLHGSLAAPRR